MTTLDLGSLVGRVALDTRQFDVAYTRVVRKMFDLGATAERSGAQTLALDRSLQDTAASMRRTAASTAEVTGATGTLRNATTEAGLAESKLQQALLRRTAAQLRVAELESSETASTRQLAGAQASLIATSDRAALAQERLAKSSGFSSAAWQSAGRKMLLTGGVIAAGFVYAAKSAAQFDARMALVQTLARANDREMSQLRQAALTVGRAYGFTASQVSDAEAELVKAGLSVKQVVGGALTGALTLAAAGQMDVASATNIAVVAMTQFHLKASQVSHIADLLTSGADKALGSVADLGEAFKYGGLAASQAGFSIEQTVGTLAEFAQAGLQGSSAGATFQQMLRSLEKPSAAGATLMKQYGIEVYGANGQMLSTSRLAGELHDKLGTLSEAQRNTALATIFGARAVRGANILMTDGAKVNAQWVKSVNDQGFAALQAAGKMNSLSGDATKLKAALQTAFIGVGEGGQGPLRSMVQDVTKAVDVWNELPGPVRASTEMLIAAAGAVTLLGGASILFIPKWAAMNAALAETRVGAISARTALLGLGRLGGTVAILGGVAAGITALDNALRHPPDVDKLTASLLQLGAAGQASGQLAEAFGGRLQYLGQEVRRLTDPGALNRLGDISHSIITFGQGNTSGLSQARDDIHGLDSALAGLVESGHADTAARAWTRLTAAAKAQGVPVSTLARVLPAYGKALLESSTSAKLAGNGIDQFGNKVDTAAKATRNAADAAKAYSDRLHGLADPLFAMNSALTALTAAQHTASKVVAKYGADSKQAAQAQQDLASKALDVETGAKTLSAAVKDGSVSLSDARKQLRGWAADGLIAKSQAKEIAATWSGLIATAGKLAGSSKKAGHAVGADFGEGMVQGLHAKDPAVRQAAQMLAKQLDSAARSRGGIDAGSPSKKARKTGQDYGQGLADGLTASEQKVASAAAALGQKAVSSAQQAIASAKSKLHADLGTQSQAASGVASSLLGGLDLSNAVINGRVGNISAFLAAGTIPLRRLGHDEILLRKMGLSPKLLAQIAGGDPNIGLALAQNILSGKSGSIHHIDELERRAGAYAKATGRLVGHALYDDRIASDRQDLHAQLGVLQRIETGISALNRTLKENPHMTGREVVGALDRVVSGAHHKAHSRTSH